MALASPIPRIGRDTQTENPASVPADCPHQSGSQGGERGGGGRDFQSPSLLRSSVQMGLPRDPTRAQPWNPNLVTAQFTNTYAVGSPQRGPLWSVVKWGLESLGLPGRQPRRVPGQGGGQPPGGVCMQMLKRVGRKLQSTSTWEDSWARQGGLEAPSQGQGWEHSPPASLWRSRERRGQLHPLNPCPSLQG